MADRERVGFDQVPKGGYNARQLRPAHDVYVTSRPRTSNSLSTRNYRYLLRSALNSRFTIPENLAVLVLWFLVGDIKGKNLANQSRSM